MVYGGAQDLETRLAGVTNPVRLVFFTQTFGCDTCLEARQVVDQIASRSPHVTVEEYNLVLDKEEAATYGVDQAPALAIVGERDYGVRYYGVPAMYELVALVDAVVLVGSGEHGLAEESVSRLDTLDHAVDLKVFVTPT